MAAAIKYCGIAGTARTTMENTEHAIKYSTRVEIYDRVCASVCSGMLPRYTLLRSRISMSRLPDATSYYNQDQQRRSQWLS